MTFQAEETGDCAALAIGPEFSRGIPSLDQRLKALGRPLPAVKVQTTGPCNWWT